MIVRRLAASAALILFAGAANAEPQTLKFAYFGGPSNPTWSKVLVPWSQDVAAASKGTIKIDTYPGGTLGRDPRAQVKLVLDGVTDIAFFVPSYTPGRFPDTELLELPGVVRNTKESGVGIWRSYAKGLQRGFEKLKVLALFTTHPYTIHTNYPVKSISDLKGKKLRAGGPVAGATLRALGAIPVGMPIPDVAQSISKGIISGAASDWNVLYAFRIADVAQHHYMGLMGTVPIGVIMSKERWEALPADAKAAFDKLSGETLSRRNAAVNVTVQKEYEDKTRSNPKHVFVDLDEAAEKKWDQTLAPIVDQWAKKHPNGKTLLATLKKDVAEVRAGK